MLSDHLSRAHLRRLRQRDLLLKPGGTDHTRLVVLKLAHGALHHIAHTVDEPQVKARAALQVDVSRLLRNKLWLGSHDGAAGAALGQLILGPLPQIYVVHIWQHKLLHKAFDEGGLSRPYRTYHADIDVPRRPRGDILIDRAVCHSSILFSQNHLLQSMRARYET